MHRWIALVGLAVGIACGDSTGPKEARVDYTWDATVAARGSRPTSNVHFTILKNRDGSYDAFGSAASGSASQVYLSSLVVRTGDSLTIALTGTGGISGALFLDLGLHADRLVGHVDGWVFSDDEISLARQQ